MGPISDNLLKGKCIGGQSIRKIKYFCRNIENSCPKGGTCVETKMTKRHVV